ncbi:MAG: histidine kinase [Sulfurimonas sp.]|nr:MAG: histidine kinase [Sulfurimonas sp.]
MPRKIAPNIYWVGMHLKNDPFQCHPYLIVNEDESILIDPGSMLEFDETVKKVQKLINIKSIRYIILHHQDPDLAAAVPAIEKLINRDDLEIVTHSRMSVLIKHYLVSSSYYEIDKHNHKLITSTGFELEFFTTPYCHSPGAFVSYDTLSKVLFSGDIFGGIEESWEFYADKDYFNKAKQFHQEYMPSKDIFNYALSKIEKLDINLIAPQHGSIIQKKYISKLIQDMKNLDCGLYIEDKYNQELTNTIAELKEKDSLLFEQSKRAEIGEMIGNIAHQWRQPLAIINAALSILREKNNQNILDKKDTEEKLQKMEQRVIYMSNTIEDFMSYYRPGKAKSNFHIYDAIDKSLNLVNIFNKNIDLNISVDKTIKINGYINEFIQVLVSILSNINDIIFSKKLLVAKIDIGLNIHKQYIVLCISDNCGGIDDAFISKIFDPYFTTKHKSMGTGLGLHIAKMIIEENMKGKLSVINLKDKNSKKIGAKFTIKINNE